MASNSNEMDGLIRYWLPLVAYCGLIFVLSSFSRPFPPAAALFGDKLLHVAEYFVLGFLAARALFRLDVKYSHKFLFMVAFGFSTLYGLSDEFHQSFVPGRNAAIGDFVADTVGALMGATVYWKIHRTGRAG